MPSIPLSSFEIVNFFKRELYYVIKTSNKNIPVRDIKCYIFFGVHPTKYPHPDKIEERLHSYQDRCTYPSLIFLYKKKKIIFDLNRSDFFRQKVKEHFFATQEHKI